MWRASSVRYEVNLPTRRLPLGLISFCQEPVAALFSLCQ
jgi:hypothetical protein